MSLTDLAILATLGLLLAGLLTLCGWSIWRHEIHDDRDIETFITTLQKEDTHD